MVTVPHQTPAFGLPTPPLPLCLQCLIAPTASESKAASAAETVNCECWSWCFPRKSQRKQRLSELTSWRRPGWSGHASRRDGEHGVGFREQGRRGNPLMQDTRLPCGLLPSQVSELLDRDITPDDYEMLLQLDEGLARPTASKSTVDSLSPANAEDFLGESCAVCLLAFESKDTVVALQCKHVYHHHCISKWLLERCRCCPLCGEEALPSA
mmetsp:Transcript_53028/g.119472  ORF Transcript_53028/g.119472 Transcript_53028/m.119472 type:complete len:211 (-) Transcript_53028:219-851(-)